MSRDLETSGDVPKLPEGLFAQAGKDLFTYGPSYSGAEIMEAFELAAAEHGIHLPRHTVQLAVKLSIARDGHHELEGDHTQQVVEELRGDTLLMRSLALPEVQAALADPEIMRQLTSLVLETRSFEGLRTAIAEIVDSAASKLPEQEA